MIPLHLVCRGPRRLCIGSALGSSSFSSLATAGTSARGEILFGFHACNAAVMSGSRRTIYRAYLRDIEGSKDPQEARLVAALKQRKIPLVRVDKEVLLRLARGDNGHQGIVLDASPLDIDHLLLPSSASKKQENEEKDEEMWPGVEWEEATATSSKQHQHKKKNTRLLVALDGITDPHNVGAILRSALLLGTDGVLLSHKNTAPLNATVSRTSAGALELLAAAGAIRYTSSLATALAAYRAQQKAGGEGDENGETKRHWRVLGAAAPPQHSSSAGSASPSSSAQGWYAPCHSLSRSEENTILVLGSEGAGLKAAVQAQCDGFVFVPTAADSKMVDHHSHSSSSTFETRGKANGAVSALAAPGSSSPSPANSVAVSAAALGSASASAPRVMSLLRGKSRVVESLNVSTAAAIILSHLSSDAGR